MQFLWPTVREFGLAKWSEMQHPTPAILDLSEAAVSCDAPVLVLMSPISLVAGDSEHNLCLDGRSCVSDVQDESSALLFQWVCRSVLARSSKIAEICLDLRKLEIDERGTIQ